MIYISNNRRRLVSLCQNHKISLISKISQINPHSVHPLKDIINQKELCLKKRINAISRNKGLFIRLSKSINPNIIFNYSFKMKKIIYTINNLN